MLDFYGKLAKYCWGRTTKWTYIHERCLLSLARGLLACSLRAVLLPFSPTKDKTAHWDAVGNSIHSCWCDEKCWSCTVKSGNELENMKVGWAITGDGYSECLWQLEKGAAIFFFFLPFLCVYLFRILQSFCTMSKPQPLAVEAPTRNEEEYEKNHVHEVYEVIADHFSDTRYKVKAIIAA